MKQKTFLKGSAAGIVTADQNHPGMLFDRRDDPLEPNNLINDPY